MDKFLRLALALREIKEQVKQLKNTASDIQKQEGKQGIPGKDGKDGAPGKNGVDGLSGKDGKDGKDGIDGKDGEDGISVTDVKIDLDNSLVITLSDGTEIDAGQIDFKKAESFFLEKQTFPQMPRIWVQNTEPTSPQPGDIWYDTST
jgi:hypothetical protein